MKLGIGHFLSGLSWFERAVAALCFALMATFTLFDVISREAFQIGHAWAQKSAVYLMIWGGYLGATLASARGTHLKPEIADQIWPAKFKPLLHFLEHLGTALFCGGMAYFAWSYLNETISMGDEGVTTGLPIWAIQIVIPYIFTSMAIRHLFYAVFSDLRPQPTERLG